MAASLQGKQAIGPRAGAPVKRVQVLGGREYVLPPRCASCEGYNLHAGVAVRASDREGLERICRYVARPPLAKERIDWLPDGRVEIGMKRTFSDGTRALLFTPAELVEKLAALVPPPHANQILYHGVLAPHAAWRKEVVPRPPPPPARIPHPWDTPGGSQRAPGLRSDLALRGGVACGGAAAIASLTTFAGAGH